MKHPFLDPSGEEPPPAWDRRRWLGRVAHAALIAGAGTWGVGCANSRGSRGSAILASNSGVPGTVIAHSPAKTGLFIGSPSIAVLPGGDYVASHDFFGPMSKEYQRARSRIFRSSNRGRSWRLVAEIDGAFWSSLFVHRDSLYLLGPDRHHGRILIRRSRDGGTRWTEPVDGHSGVLRSEPEFHCAPMPVLEHAGRLWRAFEWRHPPEAWGVNYRAGVLSAPVDADLLDSAQWKSSDFLASDRSWNQGDMGAWLEGNMVVGPDGTLWDLLRVETRGLPEKGALVRVGGDGRTMTFDPASGFVGLPGGAKKFAVRRDPRTGSYWTLASVIAPGWESAGKPASVRNTLALLHSEDLRRWDLRAYLLHHPDWRRHGFQYVDWLFDGDDLIAVCRTAFDDTFGGAHNAHDANHLTFHRIQNFRSLRPRDSVALTRPSPAVH